MPVAFDNSEFQISAHQDQEAGESSHQESPSRSNLCTNAVGSASRPSVRNSPEPSTSHTRAALLVCQQSRYQDHKLVAARLMSIRGFLVTEVKRTQEENLRSKVQGRHAR
jgi:hypothetical protein